jgi:hypothetical protein
MGFYRGPKIVTDGLVLYLDAANRRSFNGEPTTNLHAIHSTKQSNTTLIGVSPISQTCGVDGWGWCNYGGTYAFNHINTLNPHGEYTMVGNLVCTASGGDYRMAITDIGSTTLNKSFTFSMWIKNNGGTVTSFQVTMSTNGDTNMLNKNLTLTNEWQYFTFTGTFTGTCTNSLRVYFFGLNVGRDILLYQAQMEEKSYPTPFVKGIRGTTVALGGGLSDLSGNNNHGELVNGPTYSSSNSGSIVFDGVDDYVTVSAGASISFQPTDFFTIIATVKPTGMGGISAVADNTSVVLGVGITTGSYGIGLNYNQIIDKYSFRIGCRSIDNVFIATETDISIGSVYHVVLSYQANGTQNIYINGILINSQSTTTFSSKTLTSATIGGYNIFRNNAVYGGNGRYGMGNFYMGQIYNRALTATEVLQNYNATKSRYNL